MIKPLHCTSHTVIAYKQPKLFRLVAVFCFTLLFLLAANISHAQAIVETFEEAPWINATTLSTSTTMVTNTGAASTVGNAGIGWGSAAVTVAASSSTIQITVSGSTTTASISGSNSLSGSANGGGTSTSTSSSYNETTKSTLVTTNTFTTSTGGPDSTGTLVWVYSNRVTTTNFISLIATSRFHSSSNTLIMPSQNSYLITPVVNGGIAMVTFWVQTAGGTADPLYIGMKTNTTATPINPTSVFNGANSTCTGGALQQFSLNSSSITVSGGTTTMSTLTSVASTSSSSTFKNAGAHGSSTTTNTFTGSGTTSYGPGGAVMSFVCYTVPASLASRAGQVIFVSDGSAGTPIIDDISIFETVSITLPSSSISACYSTSAQTVNLPYSFTSGNPTKYTISGSTGGLFDVSNVTLPTAPNNISISLPAGTAPAVFTANLTVTDGTSTSITYPITLTVNGAPGPGLYTVPAGDYAFYKMAGSAADSIGNDAGTLVNAPTATTDRFGRTNAAYTFNGTSQYISTSTNVDAADPQTYTESIWFKTSTANEALMGFSNSTSSTPASPNNHDRVLYLSAGKVVFAIYNTNTAALDSISSSLTYNDNKWHMASIVSNGTSGFTLYVDGVQVSASVGSYAYQTYTGSAYLIIGYHDLGAGGVWALYSSTYNFFTGSLDDALLDNNTAYTAAQIYALYTGIAATSNSPICIGSTLGLAEQVVNTGSATNTYSWTGPNGFTSSLADPTRSNSIYADSGEYYITATNPTTGCTLTDSVDVAYTTTYWAYTVPTGTGDYYNFSGNANDSIGVTNGTLIASPTATTNRYGVANKAYTFNGLTQYVTAGGAGITPPTTFSESVWFKTTTANAGILMEFNNVNNGTGATHDRVISMPSNGQILFGCYNSGVYDTLWSYNSYNDGNWHLATGTLSPTLGQVLYIDGQVARSNASFTVAQQVGTGFWVIGRGSSTSLGWGSSPGLFKGSLDDIAISTTTAFSAASVAEEFYGLNPSGNNPCPGSALSLSESFTATGATYAWTGPGSPSFTPSAAVQSPTVASPVTTGEYYITATTSAGCNTIDSIAIIGGTNYMWTGKAGTSNWSTGTNWACGSAPGTTDNVTVPNVTPTYLQPVLTGNVTINNIVDSPSATIGLGGFTLTINGALTSTGTISGSSTSGLTFGSTASSATLYMTSAANTLGALTLGDSTTTHHTITLGNALNIASTGTLTVGSTTGAALATGGFLTLISDNSGSARVAAVPVNGSGVSLSTISGSVAVQSYMHSTNSSVSTARRAWRLITVPVTNKTMGTATTLYTSWQNSGTFVSGVGTMITAPTSVASPTTNGLDLGINGNYSAYTWSIATQALVHVLNTKTQTIAGINGSADNTPFFIFVRGDRTPNTVNFPWLATINNTTLSGTGVLQLGDQTFSSGSMATNGGLYLVGNPYASSVDFSMLGGDTAGFSTSYLGTNTVNRFYVWNANLTGSQNVGGYICIDDPNKALGYYTKSLGGSGRASIADKSIQSGEAFFIQNNAANTAAAITFKEFAKNTTNNWIYRPEDDEQVSGAPVTNEFGATLSLLDSDGTTSLTDGVVAQFNNAYCGCVDYVDAPKFSNIDEMFSLAREGKQLCIERRPEIVNSDTLFLNLKQMALRDYEFNFTTNMPDHPGIGVHIEDSFTHVHTPLNMSGSNTLDFTMGSDPASQAQNRFMVVFGALNITPAYTNINATRAGNTVVVQWSLSNDQQMTGYALQRSTDGINYTTIYTTAAQHTTGAYSWIDTNPVAGTNYYRVLSTDQLNEESYSSVVSIIITSLNPEGITVYPNPTQNGQIGLAMNNMTAGNYHYRLLSNLGQEVQTGSFSYQGDNGTVTIPLSKSITHGAYELEIFSPADTKTVVNIVID